jgi:hypothetical protein
MKNVIFLPTVFFFFILSMSSVLSAFCCNETPGQSRKCWTYGVCCKKGTPDEYWHPAGCFGLKVWVEPESRAFTVGKKTSINLYLKNEGTYPDNYEVDYAITEGNPALIQVDLSGASSAENMDPEEVRVLYPRITVISAQASGEVLFNVTSEADPNLYRIATFRVLESGMPKSLEEFDTVTFFLMSVLFVVIYFLKVKR